MRNVTLVVLAVLLLAGCKLDRRGLIGLGRVSPQQLGATPPRTLRTIAHLVCR